MYEALEKIDVSSRLEDEPLRVSIENIKENNEIEILGKRKKKNVMNFIIRGKILSGKIIDYHLVNGKHNSDYILYKSDGKKYKMILQEIIRSRDNTRIPFAFVSEEVDLKVLLIPIDG